LSRSSAGIGEEAGRDSDAVLDFFLALSDTGSPRRVGLDSAACFSVFYRTTLWSAFRPDAFCDQGKAAE
jgi:hypothetical protein